MSVEPVITPAPQAPATAPVVETPIKQSDVLYGAPPKVETPVAPVIVDPAKPAETIPPATPVVPVEPGKEVVTPDPAAISPEKKPEEKKPEEIVYDLKLPDGSDLKQERLKEITDFAKATGLSQENAQKILDQESKAVSDFKTNQKQAVDAQVAEWATQSKADKEIGGENFGKNAELAKRVVHRFGSPEFVKSLNDSGFGNHPELLRLCVRIGQAMAPDSLVLPGSQGKSEPKRDADILYDHTPKK